MPTIAKWREFENEVCDWLRASDYEVERGSNAAKPRQTDIYAKDESSSLLIEVKDRKRNVDVNDIDSLRSRLKRVTSDIVGVIVTSAKISSSAIRAIEEDRVREVIAFDRSEVAGLRAGRQNFRALVHRKRKELRTRAKVWFGGPLNTEFVTVKLPRGNVEFRLGKGAAQLFEAKGHFGCPLFAINIPDPAYGMLGNGVRLTLDVSLGTIRDLRNLAGYLHENFGLSDQGSFVIEQRECCWFGAGLDAFFTAVTNWDDRYRSAAAQSFHNSESFRYFDKCGGGWLELASQQRIHRGRYGNNFIFRSEIVVHLPGIPVDPRFEQLCKYVGNRWACFDPLTQPLRETVRLSKPLSLKVLGFAIEQDEPQLADQTVVGVISRNPFYRRRVLPKELAAFHSLRDTEILICDLRNRHRFADAGNSYELVGLEMAEGGAGQVLRPWCNARE
jgi:Holliday junction resolvase-like predicted endonuclease